MHTPPAPSAAVTVHFRLDGTNTISETDAAWDDFAESNAAEEVVGEKVIGHSVFEYVADNTTRMLYTRLYERVRAGYAVAVPFRCDAPDVRRFMDLRLSPGPSGSISCAAVTVTLEHRAAVALLDSQVPRIDAVLRMCGWCKRIPVGSAWLEVEDAVTALKLLDAHTLPSISHGICPDCEAAVMAVAAA